MSTPYPPRIDQIQNGEPVNAATANRPTQELGQRTDSLKEVVDNALFGSAMLLRNAPMTTDTVVGSPVYLDNGQFRPAQHGFDTEGVEYSVSRSTWCSGLVAAKTNSTQGDVVTMGLLRLTRAQLQAITDSGNAETGQLFLSSAHAGKLTSRQPPIGVQVAFCDGPDAADYFTLLVVPFPRNTVEAHIHYRLPLTMAEVDPTYPDGGAGWVDTVTYASWFVANGIPVPDGATWWYYHDRDANLASLWPPVPVGTCELRRNGLDMRIDGEDPAALINYDGIWYLRETYPPDGTSNPTTDLDNLNAVGESSDRIDLLIVKQFGKTSVVSSLTPADATIVITDLNGNPAATGALRIRAQFPLAPSDNTAGYLPVKLIDNMVQKRGVVVEGLLCEDDSIVLEAGVPVSGDLTPSGFLGGRVKLRTAQPPYPPEGSLTALAFDNADLVDYAEGVWAYVFRTGTGQASAIRGMVRIPVVGVPAAGLAFRVEATVLGKANGVLPDLPVTVRRIPQPATPGVKLTLPGADSALGELALSSCGSVTADQYLRLSTDALTVKAGDLVYVTLQREASDGYAGDLGILDLKWTLNSL